MDPGKVDPNCYPLLGVALARYHQFDTILNLFKHAAETKNYEALLALSVPLVEEDRHQEVSDALLRIEKNRTDSSAVEELSSPEKLPTQHGSFDQIATPLPANNDSTAEALLSATLTQQTTIESLYKLFQQVANIAVENGKISSATQLLAAIGNSLAQKGGFRQIAATFQWAADTENIPALSTLGITLAQHDRLDEIARLFQHAVRVGDGVALVTLGTVLAQQNKFKEISTLSKFATDTNNNEALIALSYALANKDEPEEKKILLERARNDENFDALAIFNRLLNERMT